MSKSNIVLNNVVLINNGRAADFLKWIHLINNKSPNYSGWETHKIQYGLKIIYVTLRAKEVDYDKQLIETVKQPWYAYKFVKYEVKPNCYGIEEIWFIKDKGWFVAGEELALWRVYQ